MKVKLIFNSPLILAIRSARVCYDSLEGSDSIPCTCDGKGCETCHKEGYWYGEKDIQFLKSFTKEKCFSIVEHINYTFEIKYIPDRLLRDIIKCSKLSCTYSVFNPLTLFITLNARDLIFLLTRKEDGFFSDEYKLLAQMMYENIPEPHKFIFEDVIKVNDNE